MHWVKKHKNVLAVCDDDLIGKILSNEKCDLKISEIFYKGELINTEKLSELLKDNANINIVGERSVNAAKKAGLACCVKKIKKVPYAIIFKI